MDIIQLEEINNMEDKNKEIPPEPTIPTQTKPWYQ